MSAKRPNNPVRRSPRYNAPSSSNQPVSRQVVRQMVKSMVGSKAEHKYYGVSNNTTVDSSGVVYPLFRPTQGDNDSSRDGDAVELAASEFHYAVGAADATNLMRIIVFKWSETTVPQPQDVIQSSYLGGVTAPLAPINWDNRSKIKVYHNRLTTMTVSTASQVQSFDIYYKPVGKPQWTQGSDTDGNNQIYVFAISDSSAGSHPNFEFGSLVSYTDM